ncbi:MAG: DUF192 domain-containing protein [Candidatus Sericytochromatia bacterium]|nr:DUF192 domain-containing protein [Candidatus Tanganyikabacteria bacterium]
MVRRGADLVVSHLRVADWFLPRLVGLGWIREFPQGHGLLIEPCNSIHTLWPAFAIDVVFLSPEGRIVRTFPGVKPMRVRAALDAHSVLELPAGTIDRFGLQPGQTLEIER